MVNCRTDFTITALALVFVLAGCSINEFGVVTAARIKADGAFLYKLKALGLHLDTRDRQPSLSFGMYEVTHIFPLICGDIEDTSTLQNSELFDLIDPQLSLSRIVGLQLKAGPGEVSVTLGVREKATLISLDRERDFNRKLYYAPDRPADTVLRISAKDACIKY